MLAPKGHNNPPIELTNMFAVCNLLRAEIDAGIRRGMTYKSIAEQANILPKTVSKIAYGETREPRANTIINILAVFGYKLYVQ